MNDPTAKRCRFHRTPNWLILALLVVECLLWMSERFQWPTWHKGYAVLIAVASVGVVFWIMLLWLVVSLSFRWRFQFSIRSLLVLPVVVALPCSWFACEMRKAERQAAVVQEIKNVGGSVVYDLDVDTSETLISNAKPSGQERLRSLLRDDFIGAVVGVNLNDRNITDAGLAHLAALPQLRELWLDGNQITDAGLAHLAALPQLQKLFLDGTQITDAGLAHLAGLTQLQELWLYQTQVTDVGVTKLQRACRTARFTANATHCGPLPAASTGLDHKPTIP